MIFADYRCTNCNYVFEVSKKKVMDDWPTKVKCPECQSKKTKRVYGIGDFDVCEGKAGNYNTGYATSVTYHPNKYGKFKGKRIK